jgi:alkylation response protein AidB-like acyl-CoA dehydrogenase
VVHGASADALIVAARTAGSDGDADGVTLFAVPKDAAGVRHDVVRLVDSAWPATSRSTTWNWMAIA